MQGGGGLFSFSLLKEYTISSLIHLTTTTTLTLTLYPWKLTSFTHLLSRHRGTLLGFYFSYIFGNKPKTWLECGPHHSINLGMRIHAPNHVRITTPCSVHVPGRLSDGESLLKRGRTLTGGYPKPVISFQFSKTPSKWRLWRFRSTWNPKLAKPILTCRMAMLGGMFSDQFIIPFMI